MISYKRDVLERQSLSEVKMGRGSPICERVHKRLWNTLKTTFLNVKLQRLCKSHHLQCITSSKDSEKLEKSLCVRDKAEDICRMPMVFGPSDDTASLISMPTKAQSCKKEAICEHDTEAPSCPLCQGSFKMECFEVEKGSMVRRAQI